MTEVRYLVVHCSATPAARDIGVKEIDLAHRQRGYFSIGYHKVVRRNGVVEDGREIDRPGSHSPGINQYSIGICLVGGADDSNDFTPAQFSTLERLLTDLRVKFPRAEIICQRDVPQQLRDRMLTAWPALSLV